MFLHLIDRQTAKAAGLKRYFTAESCKREGIAERLVSTSDCLCSACKKHISDRKRKHRTDNPDIYAERYRIYYINNKESEKSRKRKWDELNSERVSEQGRKRYQLNKNNILARHKKWRRENLALIRKHCAKYRASKLNATPPWFGELDDFVLGEATQLCHLRKIKTGFNWSMDHMIPIQAKSVCGLHVWNNFQVIPTVLNSSKKNRLIYTSPHDWLLDIPKFFRIINA